MIMIILVSGGFFKVLVGDWAAKISDMACWTMLDVRPGLFGTEDSLDFAISPIFLGPWSP